MQAADCDTSSDDTEIDSKLHLHTSTPHHDGSSSSPPPPTPLLALAPLFTPQLILAAYRNSFIAGKIMTLLIADAFI